VDEEIQIVTMDIRHRMTYGNMAGQNNLNPMEQLSKIEEMDDEIHDIAYLNVKEELVMKELMDRDEFAVDQAELEAYALQMSEKENTSMELIKKFFGDDLAMLEGSIRRKKAEDWIYEKISSK
jgi:FKBP-type peptidyl-prolyl cis-trans isomerase (trigger factor)